MGQDSIKKTHEIRHMNKYLAEILDGSYDPQRAKELKEHLVSAKSFAFEMYKDSYVLIMKIDGEMMKSPEELWKKDIEAAKIFSIGFGDYSHESLHAVRHIEDYAKEIKGYSQDIEEGTVSDKDIEKLKLRLGTILRLSVSLYYDAEKLIRMLED